MHVMLMDNIGLGKSGHVVMQAWENMGKKDSGIIQYGHGELIGIW